MKELLCLLFISIFLTIGSSDNTTLHTTSTAASITTTGSADTTATPANTTIVPIKTTDISTTTTTKPTTTVSPGPSSFIFNNCSELSAAISIVGKSASVNVPPNSHVNGSCGKARAKLILTWSNDSVTFNFLNANGTVYLEEVAIKLANASENKTIHMKLSADKTFYSCPETVFHLKDYNVSLVALKVQVFNYNSSFSGNGEQCGAVTTISPITTPVPSSTVKPTPVPIVTDKYTVNGTVNGTDVTCLIMFAAIKFNIPYVGKKQNTTYKSGVGKYPDFQGSCNMTTDTLKIVADGVTLDFTFRTNKSNTYSLYELKLTANTTRFPGGKGDIITANYTNQHPFKLNVGDSYHCKSQTPFHLSSSVNVFITDLQIQAFRNSNSQDIGGKRVICAGDQKTNSIVPIAVGAALAGLVVIVLIAYLIGRKRSRRGYESV